MTVLPPTRAARRRAHRRVAFGQVVWPHVSVEELDDLDAKMRHLNTDIVALSAGLMPPITDGDAWAVWWTRSREIASFQWDWSPFYIGWAEWRDDHYGEISRTGDGVRQEFDNLIAGYNERLRDFKQRFGEDATTVTPTTPAGKAAAKSWGDITSVLKLAIVGAIAYVVVKEVRNR